MANFKKENLPLGSSKPKTAQTSSSDAGFNPRHIRLPFDLRDRDVKIDDNVLQALSYVFPHTTEVSVVGDRAYLAFTVTTRTGGPWPLTVAGLPVTITDGSSPENRPLFPMSRPGNMSIRICGHIDARTMSLTNTSFRRFADAAVHGLRQQVPDLLVVEIMLNAEKQIRVFTDNNTDLDSLRSQLPGRIAQCWTMYLHDSDIGRKERGRIQREIRPSVSQSIVDNTPYAILRPGSLVHSPKEAPSNSIMETSTGVLVKNNMGDKFITAASHGINNQGELFQQMPLSGRRLVGKAVHELTCTDIALVKLEDRIQYSNESFTEPNIEIPPILSILGQDPSDEINMTHSVFLDSPFTGGMEGIVMAKSLRVTSEPPHPAEAQFAHTIYDWAYLGQNAMDSQSPMIPDSTCGSAVWDTSGRVIGFFRYYMTEGRWKGFYAAVSADEVVKAGYMLA